MSRKARWSSAPSAAWESRGERGCGAETKHPRSHAARRIRPCREGPGVRLCPRLQALFEPSTSFDLPALLKGAIAKCGLAQRQPKTLVRAHECWLLLLTLSRDPPSVR